MQSIRIALAVVIGLFLMLVISANMTPVDIHVLPPGMGIDIEGPKAVPLALVITGALLAGILIGLLIEFTREAKFRRQVERNRIEIRRLREENEKLAERLGLEPGDIMLLPA